MKTWKKVAIGLGVVAVGGGIVAYTMNQANRDVVTVQTGKVAEQDITSVVTASGEIRPKTYANVLGEGMGKIVEVGVKEGDTVRRGDVLLRLESIQHSFDVDAQQAALSSAQAAVRSAEAE